MVKGKKIVFKNPNLKCSFCENKIEPDYKGHEALKTFITERGKILGRIRTGLCLTHQRRLGLAVKRARHLARLPFVARVS